MNNKNQNYFDLFLEMAEILNEAIQTTNEVLNDFNLKKINKQLEQMHIIESNGDELSHQIMRKVSKDFITPLEREDIISLAHSLDDVIDSVEDIIIKIYMYNIKSISVEAIEFFSIIEKCGEELFNVLKELPNFKKSKTIRNSIIEINRLEELGDNLYMKTIHQLYQNQTNPIELLSWTKIYNSLERCCDECEKIADLIDNIIIKNT